MSAPRASTLADLEPDEQAELREQFRSLDLDANSLLDIGELKAALDSVGHRLPQYKVRQLLETCDRNRDDKLDMEEFVELCRRLRSSDISASFRTLVRSPLAVKSHGGMSAASSEGTTHTVKFEEQRAFANWINSHLKSDPDLEHLLPIDDEGALLYDSVRDGILLCKLINQACPETIDTRAINRSNLNLYTKRENLTLAINTAESIGCSMINIDSADLSQGKPHLVLAFIWQVIRQGLFNQISLEQHPELVKLLREGERVADLVRLSPEAILLRWVNHHLREAGSERRLGSFTTDLRDSVIYAHLLQQISPSDSGVASASDVVLSESDDLLERAERMLSLQADRIECRSFVEPPDVVSGEYKLNVAFVANLFNKFPGLLDAPTLDLDDDASLTDEEAAAAAIDAERRRIAAELAAELEGIEGETREEKTYRNWINSLGVDPRVNWIYSDLCDGRIVFQIYEIIRPGMVQWKRVVQKLHPRRAFVERVENCNYAIELGKKVNFSLVGISGQDISDGNPTLTLALIWQLMRAYTLTILSKVATVTSTKSGVVEKEILAWANAKLKTRGCMTINGFQDPSISDARIIFELVDAIKPGSVNFDALAEGKYDDATRMQNAKYALSMARKIGAHVYALPEDIVEVKAKMVMTLFACLMAADHQALTTPHKPASPIEPVTPMADKLHKAAVTTSKPPPKMASLDDIETPMNKATDVESSGAAIVNDIDSVSFTPEVESLAPNTDVESAVAVNADAESIAVITEAASAAVEVERTEADAESAYSNPDAEHAAGSTKGETDAADDNAEAEMELEPNIVVVVDNDESSLAPVVISVDNDDDEQPTDQTSANGSADSIASDTLSTPTASSKEHHGETAASPDSGVIAKPISDHLNGGDDAGESERNSLDSTNIQMDSPATGADSSLITFDTPPPASMLTPLRKAIAVEAETTPTVADDGDANGAFRSTGADDDD